MLWRVSLLKKYLASHCASSLLTPFHWMRAQVACKSLTEDSCASSGRAVTGPWDSAGARWLYGESTALQRILSWSAARREQVRGWQEAAGKPRRAALEQPPLSRYSSRALFTQQTHPLSLHSDKSRSFVPADLLRRVLSEEVCTVFHRALFQHILGSVASWHSIVSHQLWQLFDSRLVQQSSRMWVSTVFLHQLSLRVYL